MYVQGLVPVTSVVASAEVFAASALPTRSVAMLYKPYVCPVTPPYVAWVAVVFDIHAVNGPPSSET